VAVDCRRKKENSHNKKQVNENQKYAKSATIKAADFDLPETTELVNSTQIGSAEPSCQTARRLYSGELRAEECSIIGTLICWRGGTVPERHGWPP